MKTNRIENISYPTSLMGSLPRSKENLLAMRKLNNNQISQEDYWNLIVKETKEVVKWQEDLGLDIITSGELYRDNYVSFVSEKIGGVQMMSMSEMLNYIDDKKSFEEILTTLDVPASSIKNPVCIGKLEYKEGIVLEEFKMVKSFTDKPIKITLPGPYLLTRSMWFAELSKNAYESKEKLGEDVIDILKKEVDNLLDLGVEIIQFDEPVLTEVVFTEGKTRTFMCAALSEKKDPKDELTFATSLIKPIMEYVKEKGILSSVHVCRGNWSTDESTLLSGPYSPLLPLFSETAPRVLGLEFSTPRAGEISSLFNSDKFPADTILGLGVINPRTEYIESVSSIVNRVKETRNYLDKEKIWLTPDCGFATFSKRPVNVYEIIEEKINVLVKKKKKLREENE